MDWRWCFRENSLEYVSYPERLAAIKVEPWYLSECKDNIKGLQYNDQSWQRENKTSWVVENTIFVELWISFYLDVHVHYYNTIPASPTKKIFLVIETLSIGSDKVLKHENNLITGLISDLYIIIFELLIKQSIWSS